jgi:hypothetical protein
MSLQDENGDEKANHEENTSILWSAFKERLGTSEFTRIHFELNEIIHEVEGLEDLVSPFTNEEIDNIVKDLPSGKSPGSDGFNTNFMKKCWRVIATNFYNMCRGSIITLYVYKASMTHILC